MKASLIDAVHLMLMYKTTLVPNAKIMNFENSFYEIVSASLCIVGGLFEHCSSSSSLL